MTAVSISLTDEEFKQCNDFAEESAKTQREYRSGGTQFRPVGLIVQDTLRGKVSEVAVRNFLKQEPFNIDGIKLDFGIYSRGKWDETDFEINNKKFSVKSAKWFSNWLLLETKDIDRGDTYDYYILVTVSRDFKTCDIRGFASNDEIVNDKKTHKLEKGDLIPYTQTALDAGNYARHADNLHNSKSDWENILKKDNKA